MQCFLNAFYTKTRLSQGLLAGMKLLPRMSPTVLGMKNTVNMYFFFQNSTKARMTYFNICITLKTVQIRKIYKQGKWIFAKNARNGEKGCYYAVENFRMVKLCPIVEFDRNFENNHKKVFLTKFEKTSKDLHFTIDWHMSFKSSMLSFIPGLFSITGISNFIAALPSI